MLAVLQTAYEKLREPDGNPNRLTVGDKLLITLQYYREYRVHKQLVVFFPA